MKIPKIPLISLPITDKSKSNKIIRQLKRLGYEVYDAKEALTILETHSIDRSQFDFPYGSFEAYKQHVLAGDLEPDIESHIMTEENHKQSKKEMDEGMLWETHSLERKH